MGFIGKQIGDDELFISRATGREYLLVFTGYDYHITSRHDLFIAVCSRLHALDIIEILG